VARWSPITPVTISFWRPVVWDRPLLMLPREGPPELGGTSASSRPPNGWLGKPYFLLQSQLPTIVSDVVAWPCLPNLTSAGIVRLTDPLEPSPCTVTVPVVSA
jgi:hypothetical protein